jgi:hypothetical protein
MFLLPRHVAWPKSEVQVSWSPSPVAVFKSITGNVKPDPFVVREILILFDNVNLLGLFKDIFNN